jgi:hypothetical protein
MTAYVPFAQLCYHVTSVIARLSFLYLIIFHQQLAHLVFEDADSFVVGLISDSCAKVFLFFFEILSIFGVDWGENGESKVFPHFFSFKQKHNVLFFIFELLYILVFDESLQFFESGLVESRNYVVNIRFCEDAFDSFLVMTCILFHFVLLPLSSVVLVVLILKRLLENVHFSFRALII